MTEEELQRLRSLSHAFKCAQSICDPVEYAARQKTLLHTIAITLLKPLYEYDEAEGEALRKRINEMPREEG